MQLEVSTPLEDFQEDKPYAYQDVEGQRKEVEAAYSLEGEDSDGVQFGFRVGDYDPHKVLVIDPVILLYAGYIGGSSNDEGQGIAVDSTGNAYVTGRTTSSEATFPVTVGPDLTFNGGFNDAFVAKITNVITVAIDIKPGSDPNSVNPRSLGKIPVAILSSATFDAPASIDTASLTFGATGTESSLAFCNGGPGDFDGEGLLDLLCHFNTQATGFQSGDTVGMLKGKTVTGTPIVGNDLIRIVPPPVLDIQLNQASYTNGETVTASTFRLANPGEADVAVKLDVWLQVPGWPPFSFFNLGSDGSFVIPAGFDQNFGPAPLFQVTSDLPRGTYEFNSRMLHPVTG